MLLDRKANGRRGVGLHNALAAAAEGYPFPTNLDLDQPVDGLTPASQAEIVPTPSRPAPRPQAWQALLDDYAHPAYDAPARIVRTVSQDNPGARAADRSELSGRTVLRP